MFGKTKTSGGRPPLPADGGENPWDIGSVAKVCQAERIGLRIHHVESRYRDGAFAQGQEYRFAERQVVGVGELPEFAQFVHVEVTFQADMHEYGVILLDYQYNMSHGGNPVNMPVVKVVLQDPEGRTAAALHEAMRDALASGQDSVEMRCWTHFDPGWDKRGAVIYGKVTAQVWAELHAPVPPAWRKPIGAANLESYPDAGMLRGAPAKR